VGETNKSANIPPVFTPAVPMNMRVCALLLYTYTYVLWYFLYMYFIYSISIADWTLGEKTDVFFYRETKAGFIKESALEQVCVLNHTIGKFCVYMENNN